MYWFWLSLMLLQAFVFCATIPLGLWMQRHQDRRGHAADLPVGGISVILPIKGLDPEAESH